MYNQETQSFERKRNQTKFRKPSFSKLLIAIKLIFFLKCPKFAF